MKDYHITIFYSGEDKGYIADVPDLKSCSAFGETPEEALAEVLIAKELWLEVAREKHKPIPSPTYKHLVKTSGRNAIKSVAKVGQMTTRRNKKIGTAD
ncbi:MAG: type II toxin-antitoxin system HicB family antitoxin [Rhizobacter sp.]|nr:type II toxin-antitoxin system HicB family antitoxin [Chlorobiales bacterium]